MIGLNDVIHLLLFYFLSPPSQLFHVFAGVRKATEQAILNANYMLHRLRSYFPIKFVNQNGLCAHEFIIDCSEFEKHRVTTMDIAKRLIDYGK